MYKVISNIDSIYNIAHPFSQLTLVGAFEWKIRLLQKMLENSNLNTTNLYVVTFDFTHYSFNEHWENVDLHKKMLDWIYDTLGDPLCAVKNDDILWTFMWHDTITDFIFKNKSDAMLFKLSWC
jgi:hypothetical protein